MHQVKRLLIKEPPHDMHDKLPHEIDFSEIGWKEYFIDQTIEINKVDCIQKVLLGLHWRIDWGFEVNGDNKELQLLRGSNIGISIEEFQASSSPVKQFKNFNGWFTDDEVLEDLRWIEVIGLSERYQIGDIINGLIIDKIERRMESHFGLTDYYCCLDNNRKIIVNIIVKGKNRVHKDIDTMYRDAEAHD